MILVTVLFLGACDGRESSLEVQPSRSSLSAPPVPTSLATSVDNRDVRVTWQNGSTQTSYFLLDRARKSGGVWTVTDQYNIPTAGGPSGVHFENDLPNGEVLRYRVAACIEAACSAFTAWVNAVVPFPPRAAGAVFAIALSDTTAVVEWEDRSSGEWHFIVLGGEDPTDLVQVKSTPPNGTSAVVRRLCSGQMVHFAVRATNGGGHTDSDTASVFMATSVPAPPPSLHAAGVAPNTVRVRWPDMSAYARTTRLGVRRFVGGVWTAPEHIDHFRGDVTRYTHTGLVSGGKYVYSLLACNYVGCSELTSSGVVIAP